MQYGAIQLSFRRRRLNVPVNLSLVLISLFAILTTAVLQFAWFDGIPHVPDANSHLFQAKIFSLGKLSVATPPCTIQFADHHILMTQDGRWFGKYPPGLALLYWLIGYLFSVHVVGPICAGLVVYCCGRLAHRFFSPFTGLGTGCLLATSPLHLLLGASYMSHTPSLALLSAGGVGLVRSLDYQPTDRRRSFALALAAGFLWGWAALVRPQECLVTGALLLVIFLLLQKPERRSLFKCAPAVILGALPFLLIWLAWNHIQYGHAFSSGYGRGTDHLVVPQYHDRYGISTLFTWSEAIQNCIWTLIRFSRAATGCFVIPLIAITAFQPRFINRPSIAATTGIILTIALYFFYDYFGYEYEARYYYLALPFLCALVSYGYQNLASCSSPRGWPTPRLCARYLIAACYGYAALFYWPIYLTPAYRHDYERVSADPNELAETLLHDKILVIWPASFNKLAYTSGAIYNDPLLTNRVIYAKDDGLFNACLRASFSERAIYFLADATNGNGLMLKADLAPSGEGMPTD